MYFKNLKRIIFIFALFLFAPILANAAAPGARSYASEDGNLFLGGNFIEIGINKDGAFASRNFTGGSGDEFASFHRTQGRLGFRINRNGWGLGEEPTTGEFLLVNDMDSFSISYKKNGTYYIHGGRGDGDIFDWGNAAITPISVTDQSDKINGKLKAKISGVTKENVELEMIISFGENDKYFLTEVKVKNLDTDNEISDVQFTKITNVTPDANINQSSSNKFKTYNKEISNPNPNKAGGNNNFAMIVSRGPVTLDGFFYLSFDNRSRIKLLELEDNDFAWEEDFADPVYVNTHWSSTTAGLPTAATNDSVSIFYEGNEENGYELCEHAIALSTKLGTIAASGTATTEFYTSLDNNVNGGLSDVLEARMSSVKVRTDSKIEIEPVSGYEYSIDNWITKNTTGVFTGLNASTEYTIKSRVAADGSNEEELVVSTKGAKVAAKEVKAVVITEDSITVKAEHGYLYSIDNGAHWQSDETFTGLVSDKEHTIIGKLEETYSDMGSEVSEPIVIKTSKHVASALDDAINVTVDTKIVDAVPAIYFNKGELYEAVKDIEEVKEAVDDGKDVKIVFDVVKIENSDEDENHFDGKKFEHAFDVQIKLYIDSEYIDEITDLTKKISISVEINKEFVKSGRKFYIVRKHDTVSPATWEIISDEDDIDDLITIYNDQFSEFYVVYEDETSNPKTGDNLLSYVLILIISISGLYFYKKLES